MDTLHLRLSEADDADLCKMTSKMALDDKGSTLSDSDGDSGYDLGDVEEDCSFVSASVGGSLSSSSSLTGGSTESLYLSAELQQQDEQPQFAVLSYEEVRRLHDVVSETIYIHGRGNFPTLELRLRDLVSVVRKRLEDDNISVRDIRLNGGAASYVLATDNAAQPYNDLDLIFGVDLSSARTYDRIKTAVLDSLLDFLPPGVSKARMLSCSLKEAYVSKMVKVTEGDRWSLISLGNHRGKNVELKFVDTMRRQFEFSVDSFQIILDSLLLFYHCAQMPVSESFYPTVQGQSVYGNFREAQYHLHDKLIATRNPEEIRGGGLLKYCNLLVKDYRPANPDEIKTFERYMCSRFFIDFPDIAQQRPKLENYLWNHFVGVDEALKYGFLLILHSVVDESTVCLMGHERRQTLSLIEELACQIYYSEQQNQSAPTPQVPYPNAPVYEVRISGCQPTVVYSSPGYYYPPVVAHTSVPPPSTPPTANTICTSTQSASCPTCSCCWVTCS